MVGTVDDMDQRTRLARKDDDDHRRKISVARDLIYKNNKAVNTSGSEAILFPESLTATAVRGIYTVQSDKFVLIAT